MTTPPPPYGAYPPPPYGGYGYPAPYGGYPQPKPTNTMAIVALVCAFVFAPVGIVFGHISLSQIKKTGEEGRGLAVAGLVISYVITALTIIVIVLSVMLHRRRGTKPRKPRRHRPGSPGSPGTTAQSAEPATTAGVQAARHTRIQLPVSGHHGTCEQARHSAAHRTGADRPRVGEREHHDQPRQHRASVGQRQGALHGEQFRQPGRSSASSMTRRVTG